MEVLALDGGRTLSPSDLSFELRAPLSNVNYHVTELLKAGLIELTSERQVRGATEHFYREANGNRPSPEHFQNGNGSNGNGGMRARDLEPARA